MPNTTLRFISDRYSNKNAASPLRRWLAILFAAAAIGAAVFVFSRDIDWDNRAREAKQRGLTAFRNGHHEQSRDFFQLAVANNPYDWQSHLLLANLLFRRLNDLDEALRHYLYSLAYSPDPAIVREVNEAIDIIRLIRSGELENPFDAIDDMFLTMESDAMAAFFRRLSTNLMEDRRAYWNAWRQRGRGTVARMLISSNSNGFYDATVELAFPDDTHMSMHLMCPMRDIWRLDLSFP